MKKHKKHFASLPSNFIFIPLFKESKVTEGEKIREQKIKTLNGFKKLANKNLHESYISFSEEKERRKEKTTLTGKTPINAKLLLSTFIF